MAIDPLSVLLTDEKLQRLLETIGNEKRARFRDLVERFQAADPAERDQLRRELERLVGNNLVKLKKAPIEDLDTYYLSSEGLAAQRQLKRMK